MFWFKKKNKDTVKVLNTETGKVEEVKPKIVARVNTKKIVYEEQEFEVGKTFIDLEFIDGTKFTVESLGRVEQSFGHGRDEELDGNGEISRYARYIETYADIPTIFNSEVMASSLLNKFGVGQVFKFVNLYDNLYMNYAFGQVHVNGGVFNPTEVNASKEVKEVVHHELRRAKIGETVPHKVTFNVAKLEDINK